MKNFKFKIFKNIFKKNQIIFDDPNYNQPKKWSSYLIITIIGSITFSIIYALLVSIDEVVVGRGELEAIGAERPIKSSYSGKLKSILIKEGQDVKSGDVLFTLDSDLLEIKLNGLIEEKKFLEKGKALQKELLDNFLYIYNLGAISKLKLIESKEKLLNIENQINQKEVEIKEIKFQLENSKISAPMNGKVFDLIPASQGYITSQGEILMLLVPEGKLEAKIFINNSDIGFIKKNMIAEIRIDSYTFSKFGFILGKVKVIGDEVLLENEQSGERKFPVIVSLDNQFLEKDDIRYPIKAGQSVSVNLRVKKKKIINIFTNTFNNSLDSMRSIK